MDISKVQQAASIISKDISKHYTIHELAELVLVNRKKLLESFKQVYGMGPFEYLAELRLEKSKTMLMENASLKRISIVIGFSGDSAENNFIRFFKRKTGCTPQAWRQMQHPQTA